MQIQDQADAPPQTSRRILQWPEGRPCPFSSAVSFNLGARRETLACRHAWHRTSCLRSSWWDVLCPTGGSGEGWERVAHLGLTDSRVTAECGIGDKACDCAEPPFLTRRPGATECTVVVVVHSLVSTSLRPRGLQRAGLPCPPPSPGACSNSCLLSR